MSHAPYEELQEKLAQAARLVTVGGRYRHYRAPGIYTVVSLDILEATEEPCVRYQTDHPSRITFVRPLSDWLSEVTDDQGRPVLRFTPLAKG